VWYRRVPAAAGGIGGDVLYYLLINFAAFFLLVASFVLLRMENEQLREKINEVKREKGL
jgi:hypothetical protein